MSDPSTRRLWLLPHDKIILTWLNPLKERKHSDNPSRLKMLREHGPAGLLLFTTSAASIVLGGVAVICGSGLLVAGVETAGNLCLLLGIVIALLTLPRASRSGPAGPARSPPGRHRYATGRDNCHLP